MRQTLLVEFQAYFSKELGNTQPVLGARKPLGIPLAQSQLDSRITESKQKHFIRLDQKTPLEHAKNAFQSVKCNNENNPSSGLEIIQFGLHDQSV